MSAIGFSSGCFSPFSMGTVVHMNLSFQRTHVGQGSRHGMNDSDQPGVAASVTQLWAKTNSTTGKWHPLLYHLVETSAVASLLWDEILTPNTCKVIADALGLPLDEARQWSSFLVGAHDLGKASPSFQSKWTPCVRPLQQLSYRFPDNV